MLPFGINLAFLALRLWVHSEDRSAMSFKQFKERNTALCRNLQPDHADASSLGVSSTAWLGRAED